MNLTVRLATIILLLKLVASLRLLLNDNKQIGNAVSNNRNSNKLVTLLKILKAINLIKNKSRRDHPDTLTKIHNIINSLYKNMPKEELNKVLEQGGVVPMHKGNVDLSIHNSNEKTEAGAKIHQTQDKIEQTEGKNQQSEGKIQQSDAKIQQADVNHQQAEAKILQAEATEAELKNLQNKKKSALLERPYVEQKGINDFLVIDPGRHDPFVTVIPNSIYYKIEKKCVNWLDDCSLRGLRDILLNRVKGPY